MTLSDLPVDLTAVATAIASLREPAPSTLRPRVLAALGLADEYASLETAIGPVYVAWNEHGISAIVPVTDPDAFEARFANEFGRAAHRMSELPARLRGRVVRRLAGDRRVAVPVDLRGGTEFERAV